MKDSSPTSILSYATPARRPRRALRILIITTLFLAVVPAVAVISGLLAVTVLPVRNTAVGLVGLMQLPIQGIGSGQAPLRPASPKPINFAQQSKALVSQLNSPAFTRDVFKHLDRAAAAYFGSAAQSKKAMVVQSVPATRLVQVAVTGTDPNVVANTANVFIGRATRGNAPLSPKPILAMRAGAATPNSRPQFFLGVLVGAAAAMILLVVIALVLWNRRQRRAF